MTPAIQNPIPPKKDRAPETNKTSPILESRSVMDGAGFQQCYIAQAAVKTQTIPVVGKHDELR